MSDLPDPPILQYASLAIDVKPRPLVPGMLRFCGLYAGVLVPLVSFGFSIPGFPLGPDWQSGKTSDYIKLMLHAQAAWPLFPLLLYSITCAALVSIAPRRFVNKAWARLGLWAGIPMAAIYSIILLTAFTEGNSESFAIGIAFAAVSLAVSAFIVWLLNWLFQRFGARRVWPILGSLIGIIALAPLLFGRAEVLGSIFFGSILLGPGWATLIYLALAIRSTRAVKEIGEQTRIDPSLIGAWLAGFTASWALAIEEAIRMYRSLPTTPPSHCYIATAAARGHRKLVRSQQITFNGQLHVVNDQLRRFKCAEIAMMAVAPRLHRFIRGIYDYLGPRLARAMDWTFAADAAYLLLWPIERLSSFALRRITSRFDELASSLYMNHEKR